MKDLNIYYFDNDLGEFDGFNPRYVMEQKYAKRIITLISKASASFFSEMSLEKKLNINHEDFVHTIKLLTNISAISIHNNKLNINFPFFNKRDVIIIKEIISKVLNNSLQSINDLVNNAKSGLQLLFPNITPDLSTYHLLCGQIFDGKMFEYLSENKLLCQSFVQNKARDYLIIGYENSRTCNNFNKRLFCSFNHAKYNNESLSSFGNADGERYDLFRYFKLKDINNIYGKFKILDKAVGAYSKKDIISKCLDFIKNTYKNRPIVYNEYFTILKSLKYINKKGKILVPVFFDYKTKIDILFNSIKKDILNTIIKLYDTIKCQILKSNITPVNNNISENAICNEIWHIFFGILNKMLIDKKIVAKPQQFYKQGRYLKCIYLL